MKTMDNGSNLDEIIFENRNKAYGAYSIRKNYKRNVVLALFITLGFLSMSVGTPYVLTYISPEVIVTPKDNGSHEFERLKLPKDEPIQRIEPPKIQLPENHLKDLVGFDFSKIDIIDGPIDTIALFPPTDPENPGTTGNEIDTGLTAYVEPPTDVKVEDPPMIFEPFQVSEQPDFIGGNEAMKKFIASHVIYPEEAKKMNIQGTVYVQFIVSPKGEITNVKVIRKADPLLDNEAIRVIESMPSWSPGKQSGYPVNVSMVLPIAFKLY